MKNNASTQSTRTDRFRSRPGEGSVESGDGPLNTSEEDGEKNSNNLDFREVVSHLTFFIKSYTYPYATIMVQDERQALLFTTTFRVTLGWDPSDIELRHHLIFRINNAVSKWSYRLLESQVLKFLSFLGYED
ncbi:unnamed protein product [Vicia faba]|uniref:Retrotransposon protein n=1 Tax=Vicia faba TaxID=3906 RepID=A0AAV0ZI66_VICFA|nr:unnamed protein product [Vicia faba]